MSAHLSSAAEAALQSAKVGKVTIDGSHASVSDSRHHQLQGLAQGLPDAGSAPTKLTKQSDGSWKISG